MLPKQIILEWKDLLIILLIGICIFIYFKPIKKESVSVLQGDNSSKDEQIKQIQKQRDSLLNERKLLDFELNKLRQLSNFRSDTINFYKKLSKSKDVEIVNLREDLRIYNLMLSKRKDQIDNLISNPIILPKNKLIEKTLEKLK